VLHLIDVTTEEGHSLTWVRRSHDSFLDAGFRKSACLAFEDSSSGSNAVCGIIRLLHI
jgi:hypothetical protein